MFKSIAILCVFMIVNEAVGQRLILPTYVYTPDVDSPVIIHPTYRPPPTTDPIIRTARSIEEGHIEDDHDLEFNSRQVRSTGNDQPMWLYQDNGVKAPSTGDHPYLPQYIDDIKLDPNRRYARSLSLDHQNEMDEAESENEYDIESNHETRIARSLDSPSAKRGGGSHTRSQGSRNTGATHPGYNRRNARSVEE